MLIVTLLVAWVVDAAVVPSETPEVFVYTATFTTKFEKSDQVLVDNLYEDRTVNRLENRKSRPELKASQQFNTYRIPSQKPPVQVSWQRGARLDKDGVKDLNGPQQQNNRAEKTGEARRNAQDQETRLHDGGVNDPGLYADQSVKDGIASASSSQSQKKTTKTPDLNTSVPPDGFKFYFGSNSVRSGTTFERGEATNRQGPQPESSEIVTETKNIHRTGNSQIFDYTSRNNAGFGNSKTTDQDSRKSDSNSKFSANTERDKTEFGNKPVTSAETGNYQRFDYTKPGIIDRYDNRKTIEDDNTRTNSDRFGANTEEKESGNRRTPDSGGKRGNDDRRTGSNVGGKGEDDDGKIYFEPDLEKRATTARAKIVTTTPATVNLDNRNAFDVNVTCGPGMEKIPGGVCAPTE